MTKTKVLIVEDELIIAEDLKQILLDIGYEVIDTVTNYDKALEAIQAQRPDIILLDIVLKGEKTGIDLATHLQANSPIPFIYITSFADRSTLEKAKITKPAGYVVKPFEKADIYTSVEIALANQPTATNSESDFLFIKEGSLITKIPHSEILWLEADGNYIDIHTTEKKHVIRSALKEVMQKLPIEQFFQIHKSFLVNIHHVKSVDNNLVYLASQQLPLGRLYKEGFLKLFKEE